MYFAMPTLAFAASIQIIHRIFAVNKRHIRRNLPTVLPQN
jgi:hypothetical protein